MRTKTLCACPIAAALAAGPALGSDFATRVVSYRPAPGQFVNDPAYRDPARALGAPNGGGAATPNNTGLVSLGGFGGSITLAFDAPVLDHPGNPMGLDLIVFGNAHWAAGDPNARWAEPAVIEVSRDENGNGLADDPWYVIPGSHLAGPLAVRERVWDLGAVPPAWIPPGFEDGATTSAYELPEAFDAVVLVNPLGPDATLEGVWGYADLSPVLALGDADPGVFYTTPDDPFEVGVTPGSGGGDAIDLAWAIDPATGEPARLGAADFVRITTGVDAVRGPFGEASAEVDAAARVRPACAAERDGAPGLGVGDLLAYLRAFSERAPLAEADGQGGIGVGDLLAYLTAFAEGC